MEIILSILLLLTVILILKMKVNTVFMYRLIREKSGFSRDTSIAITALAAIETGWWKNYFIRTHFNPFSLHWSRWQAKYGGQPGEYERDDKSSPITRFPSIEKGVEAAIALLKNFYKIKPYDDWNTVYSKLYERTPRWALKPPTRETFLQVCQTVEKRLKENGSSD
jgi:hypothetical protein